MYFGKYHPGCGGGGEGNQGCKIARCAVERGNVEYCFRYIEYPCEKYEQIDEDDSFITHRNQKSDIEKAEKIGIEAYDKEQKKKMQILNYLLMNFNSGRRKALFCQAVNFTGLNAPHELRSHIEQCPYTTIKEKGVFSSERSRIIADYSSVSLTLRRKKAHVESSRISAHARGISQKKKKCQTRETRVN